MKKQVLSFALAFGAMAAHAQSVGIGTVTPDASSQLEVKAANKGVLLTRVTLQSVTDASTILTPATGLIVYNTNAGLAGGTGFYYNSGTPAAPRWTRMAGVDGGTAPTTGQTIIWNGSTYLPGNPAITTNTAVFGGNGTAASPLTINTASPVYNANKINGTSVSSTAPTATGQVLVYNSTSNTYAPGTISGDNWGTQVATVNATTMSGNGAGTPLTANNTSAIWNANAINNKAVDFTTAPTTGQTLIYDGTKFVAGNVITSGLLGGNGTSGSPISFLGLNTTNNSVGTSALSGLGTATSPLNLNTALPVYNANSIQGKPVSNTAPSNGQALVYSSSANAYVPGTVGGDNWGTQVVTTSTANTALSGNGTAASPLLVNVQNAIFNANKINGITVSGTPASGQTIVYNGTNYVPKALIDSTTASNGVQMVNNEVQLGGTITSNTNIAMADKTLTLSSTSGIVNISSTADPLKLTGLQQISSTSTYKNLVVDGNGVVKTSSTMSKVLAAYCDGDQPLGTGTGSGSFNAGNRKTLTFIPSDIIVNTGGIYSFNDATDEFTVLESGTYEIQGYSGYVSDDNASNGTTGNNLISNAKDWGQGINLSINVNGTLRDGTRYIYTKDMAHTAEGSTGYNFIATVETKTILNLNAGDKITLALAKVLGNDAADPHIVAPTGLTQSKKIMIIKL